MKYKIKDLPLFEDIQKIYFVGIKGVGTMPLSLIAKEAGIDVGGSDLDEEFITDKYLMESGIKIDKGFEPNHIHDFFHDNDPKKCLVVTTGAHKGYDNPQVKWAKDNNFEVVSQGQALSIFMEGTIFDRSFKSIAVAASHGKTTISSLLATCLNALGDDTSYTVGSGEIFPLGAPGHYGRGEYFVAEADEYASEPVYDRVPKFLYLRPNFAIFNNIDFDHPDLFQDIRDIKDAFLCLSENIKSGGILFANGDDKYLKDIKKDVEKDIKIISYGEGNENDYVISKIVEEGLGSKFTVSKKGEEVGFFEIMVPGIHNAKNSLSVIACLLELGFDKAKIRSALTQFTGTKRRLEKLGINKNGVIIFDDYGHHPAEINATLSSLKKAFPDKKISCVFQSHTFSRTKALMEDFSNSFSNADKLILLPVFKSQRDTENDSMEIEKFVDLCRKNIDTEFFNSQDDVVEYLRQNCNSDSDLVLTIGAGDVYKIGQEFLK